jgi:SAM-dependent MidA family methyltransferase
MFGELIAVWLCYERRAMGHTDNWQLIECGAGNGSLCADVLRALHHMTDCAKNIQRVCIVERR